MVCNTLERVGEINPKANLPFGKAIKMKVLETLHHLIFQSKLLSLNNAKKADV
jgi:hypothetical protein